MKKLINSTYRNRSIIMAFLVTTGTTQAATISTVFASNNNGSPGGAVYFDLGVTGGNLSITGLSSNFSSLGTSFTDFKVYFRQLGVGETFANFSNSATGWNLAATGNGTFQPVDTPTPVILDSTISLISGFSYAFALIAPSDARHYYTNGTGLNQSYSNTDLFLSFGAASNAPFGTRINNRVWNGSITYDTVSAVPEPSSVLALGGLICGGLMLRVRRKSA
jgi:hypothetical protein